MKRSIVYTAIFICIIVTHGNAQAPNTILVQTTEPTIVINKHQ